MIIIIIQFRLITKRDMDRFILRCNYGQQLILNSPRIVKSGLQPFYTEGPSPFEEMNSMPLSLFFTQKSPR